MLKAAEKIESVIPHLELLLPGANADTSGSNADMLALHRHRHREIFVVLDTVEHYPVDGRVYELKPGSAVFIDSGQHHGCYHYRNVQWQFSHLWIMLYPRRISITYSEQTAGGRYSNQLLEVPTEALHWLNDVWERLRSSPAEEQLRHLQQLHWIMSAVLGELALDLRSRESGGKSADTGDVADFIADYIENHSGCGCSLANLAKLTGYTTCYISHFFRSKFQKTVGDAVNEARMHYLIEQLEKGASSKLIAEALEFASPQSFWKWRRNNSALEKKLRRSRESDKTLQ